MNAKGVFGENYATGYLSDQGYEIVERNFRTPYGEIDIIAADDTYIVFVEVKARCSGKYGLPRDSITNNKRKRIVQTALLYLSGHTAGRQPRFDVVEILCNNAFTCVLELTHIKNAFTAEVNDEAF